MIVVMVTEVFVYEVS